MFKDKKIKSAINNELKAQKLATFEEFCESNGYRIEPDQKPRRVVALWKKVVFPTAAVAAVALCVALPITLANSGGGSEKPTHGITYNVGHEITKKVEFSELMRDAELVLYNTEYERSQSYSAFLCADNDMTFVLAYLVKNVVYGGMIDDTLYAYQFDFLARCYDGYAETYTAVLEYYKRNGEKLDCGDVEYYYGITDSADGQSAVICYENGKYDYFIRLRLLSVGTSLTEDRVEDFIKIAFTEDVTHVEA